MNVCFMLITSQNSKANDIYTHHICVCGIGINTLLKTQQKGAKMENLQVSKFSEANRNISTDLILLCMNT